MAKTRNSIAVAMAKPKAVAMVLAKTRNSPAMAKSLAMAMVIAISMMNSIAGTPSLTEVYSFCSDPSNYTDNSSFAANFETLVSRLLNESAALNYANASSITTQAGSAGSNDTLYGVFQCRGDLNQSDCSVCVSAATASIEVGCSNKRGGQVLLDSCFFRYENTSAFYNTTNPEMEGIKIPCSPQLNADAGFQASVMEALEYVSASAPLNGGFAVAPHTSGGAYALAQCFGYLSSTNCRICLSNIQDVGRSCPNASRAQMNYESCYYRYDSTLFYNTLPVLVDSQPLSSPSPYSPGYEASNKSSQQGLIVAGVVLAFFLVFLAGVTLCICKRRKAKRNRLPGHSDDEKLSTLQGLAVQFSYTELKTATRNFTDENKIGEGGFGPVYKGMLEDGREVAIKKLSSISHQGKREFMNEVNTITSVQHRNLIRLLGCCVEGREKLLVYEYLPNKSLDSHLFIDDPMDLVLDWDTRFKIILGIARGLAYLHHGSQIRIIHRDIKTSNILLANDLTPKIADFGLAKLVADDRSCVSSTRVVGTFGYMAPEYAMRGQLTDKADVFSFGLVALEVVSGRRNNDLQQPPNKQHLLEWAWEAFKDGHQTELVDQRMAGEFSGEEAIRIVHVALLCTQSISVLRPKMRDVIQFLVGQSEILDTPTVPAFINTNLASPSLLPASTTYSSSSGDITSQTTRLNNSSCSMSQIEGR